MTLTYGEVGSMFLCLEYQLTCDHGGSDGMTSVAIKVLELLPCAFGTLTEGTFPSCHKGGQAAHRETWTETRLPTQLKTSTNLPAM